MLASTMFIPNPRFTASSVKIAAMSLTPIKGTSVLATITFDVKGDNPPVPAVVRSKLAASTGSSVKHDTPSQPPPSVVTGDKGTYDVADSGGNVTGGTGITGSGGSVTVSGGSSVGTVTLPQDEFAAAEAGRKTEYQPLVTDLRKDMTLPLGDTGSKQSPPGEQATEAAKELPKKSVSYKSALQLFKEFKGEKSSKSLIPLFAEVSAPDFRQEPAIAISDGKTPLKITLSIKQTGSSSPKFLLQGANVKQLSGEGEETIIWTIDAIPRKDAVEAVLTVIDGQTVMDFPLTITPRIEPLLIKAKELSEADFAAYLAKPAKFDLNKDGEFDAVDDFIYTANYIVAMKIKPEKARKEEKADTAKPEKAGKEEKKDAAKPATGTKDDLRSKEPVKGKGDKAAPEEKPSAKPSAKP
jgi:hypothetical protein